MNHRTVRLQVAAAAIFAALLSVPPMFGQTPIRVSTFGIAFAPVGRSAAGEVVGKGRRFRGQTGERLVLRGLLQMPPFSSGVQKMQRLIVRFRSTQSYLSYVELRNGSTSEFRISTRLEGDHTGETLKPESIANTWVFREPVHVDSHSVILLEVEFAGGFEGNSNSKEFFVATVDAEFPGKPLALSSATTEKNPATALSVAGSGGAAGRGMNPSITPVASNAMIYVLANNNDLLWYGHSGREVGGFSWASPVGQKVGSGWNFKQVFPGDDGVIYAVTAGGDLMWYRHEGRLDGTFRWTSMTGKKVGTGWNYDHVFSGGGGVIYAITPSGDLLWFRHDGQKDGTDQWAPPPPAGRRVGIGWICKHVFAGGGGVIYAVMANNDLMWFRHDGRGDGSFTWAEAQGKRIAVNWDFKRLFSSGGGVIYAVTAKDELLWLRHDGHGDGSSRWTDTKGRGVGNGWAFKEVFSGATLAP